MEGSILKLSNGSYVLYGKGIPDITRSCFIAMYGIRTKNKTVVISFETIKSYGPDFICSFLKSKSLFPDKIIIATCFSHDPSNVRRYIISLARAATRSLNKPKIISICIERLMQELNLNGTHYNWFDKVIKSMLNDNRFLVGQIEDRLQLKQKIDRRKSIEESLKKKEDRLKNFKSAEENGSTNINNILKMKWIDTFHLTNSKDLDILTKPMACTYVPNIAKFYKIQDIMQSEILYRIAKYQALGKYFITLPYHYIIQNNFNITSASNDTIPRTAVRDVIYKGTYFHGTACHIGNGSACLGELSAAISGAAQNGLDMLLMSFEVYLRSINLPDAAGQRFFCLPMGDKDGNIEVWPYVENFAKENKISLKGLERNLDGYEKFINKFEKKGYRLDLGVPCRGAANYSEETQKNNMEMFLGLVKEREPRVYEQIMDRIEKGAVL